jgi:hypothetical protein
LPSDIFRILNYSESKPHYDTRKSMDQSCRCKFRG